MSLTTPEKIRKLKRAFYVKAKEAPSYRFHQLYDKVWKDDILRYAYQRCKANKGGRGSSLPIVRRRRHLSNTDVLYLEGWMIRMLGERPPTISLEKTKPDAEVAFEARGATCILRFQANSNFPRSGDDGGHTMVVRAR